MQCHVQTLLVFGLAAVGLVLYWMSNRQPFPEISKIFAALLLFIVLLLVIALGAPDPITSPQIFSIFTLVGGLGVVMGTRHMVVTRRDVLVAPFAGALFCAGVTGLFWFEWDSMTSTFEQIINFLLLCSIFCLEVYLVFRGLLIGRLSRAWSQSGLRQISRGLIKGEMGAISCFEKAWDMEEEHLNSMAYLALQRCNLHIGEITEAEMWAEKLAELGGEDSVAKEWISAIDEGLSEIGMDLPLEKKVNNL